MQFSTVIGQFAYCLHLMLALHFCMCHGLYAILMLYYECVRRDAINTENL